MSKVCYFDIETKYTFQELDNRWKTLSYNQQNEIRDDLIPKMGLATSCVISEENSDKAIFFNEGDEKELISFIDGFDTIIGHNLLHFDYLVLSPFYDHGDIIDHFAKKTIDTLDYLKKRPSDKFFLTVPHLTCNNFLLRPSVLHAIFLEHRSGSLFF